MVIALLEGRKTQTRRLMKPQPIDGMDGIFSRFPDQKSSPYGDPGDLLWVREAGHFLNPLCPSLRSAYYKADGVTGLKWKPSIHMPRWASRLTLELTGVRVERLHDISEADAIAEGCFFTDYGRRCFHQGQGDATACPALEAHHLQNPGWMWDRTVSHDQCLGSARFAYGNLWESINGPGSWDANPWVWVLNFRIHQANVDSLLKARAA